MTEDYRPSGIIFAAHEPECYWDAVLTEHICPKHGHPIADCPEKPFPMRLDNWPGPGTAPNSWMNDEG